MRIGTKNTFNAWITGRKFKNAPSIWTDGQNIYSYGTVIVRRDERNTIHFNVTRYSKTTSTHQNGLMEIFRDKGISYVTVDNG